MGGGGLGPCGWRGQGQENREARTCNITKLLVIGNIGSCFRLDVVLFHHVAGF